MRLTPQNKSKITQRIVASAAAAFRAHGYDDVNIDQIMEGAGLTRGAFYAHFKSKAEVFGAVVRSQHPLLKLLRQRTGTTAQALGSEMLDIFRAYLAPENLKEVFEGCTLAALTGDATRADEAVRQSYEAAWQEILEEMARGQKAAPDAFIPALVLASGAVRTARALFAEDARARLLAQSFGAFQALMAGIAED